MAIYKPSSLSPNFEEVVYNQPILLSFEVHSNGSTVIAYKLEILNSKNDEHDPQKDILYTIEGEFDTPLYNGDIGQILVTPNTDTDINGAVINLLPNVDYRWRLRLYSNDLTFVGNGMLVGSTK